MISSHRHAGREGVEDHGDRNAGATDARLAVAYGRVDRDSVEQIVICHGIP